MYCTECGAEIPEDVSFCGQCGKAVISKQESTTPQENGPPPIYRPPKPKKKFSERSTGGKIGVIFGILLAIFLVISPFLLLYFGFQLLSTSPRIGITMMIIGGIIIGIYIIGGVALEIREEGCRGSSCWDCCTDCP
ncbi:MAG: zinc-ribbon domain-containing protein [Promethearchaeota archaeon]